MRMIFFFFFTVLAASVQRKVKGPHDFLLERELGIKRPEPITVLCRLIFEFFEEDKVREFGKFLNEHPFHSVSQIIHHLRIYEETESGDYVGETTFIKLFLAEGNLFLLFARHFKTCPFIRDLAASMAEEARRLSKEAKRSPSEMDRLSKRISIVGFIYRLGGMSERFINLADSFDLFDMSLYCTLGNEFQPEWKEALDSASSQYYFRSFGNELIGEFFPRNTHIFTLKLDEIQSNFKFLFYTLAEIKFCEKFLENFLALELRLGNEDMPAAKDPILGDVISEMREQKSILKPFIVHSGEIAYERLISLMSFYSENFRLKFKSSLQGRQLVRFLRIFQNHTILPNLPIPAINMLCGYYIRDIKASQKDALDIVLKLSDEERRSLKSLQPSFPFIITGISDPNCINPQEILESLLQLGITGYNAPIYVLAKFSLIYILNPVKSLSIFDLEKEAETNNFIKEVLSYEVELYGGKVMPFLEFLSNYGSTQVFGALKNVPFSNDLFAFNDFFKELVSIYYYPKFDPLSYLVYFKSDDSFKKFLLGLWAAKHGEKLPLGFGEIISFFPASEGIRLEHMIDYKKNFFKWLNTFLSLFQEYIIGRGLRI